MDELNFIRFVNSSADSEKWVTNDKRDCSDREFNELKLSAENYKKWQNNQYEFREENTKVNGSAILNSKLLTSINNTKELEVGVAWFKSNNLEVPKIDSTNIKNNVLLHSDVNQANFKEHLFNSIYFNMIGASKVEDLAAAIAEYDLEKNSSTTDTESMGWGKDGPQPIRQLAEQIKSQHLNSPLIQLSNLRTSYDIYKQLLPLLIESRLNHNNVTSKLLTFCTQPLTHGECFDKTLQTYNMLGNTMLRRVDGCYYTRLSKHYVLDLEVLKSNLYNLILPPSWRVKDTDPANSMDIFLSIFLGMDPLCCPHFIDILKLDYVKDRSVDWIKSKVEGFSLDQLNVSDDVLYCSTKHHDQMTHNLKQLWEYFAILCLYVNVINSQYGRSIFPKSPLKLCTFQDTLIAENGLCKLISNNVVYIHRGYFYMLIDDLCLMQSNNLSKLLGAFILHRQQHPHGDP